jgi:hypothetical protein
MYSVFLPFGATALSASKGRSDASLSVRCFEVRAEQLASARVKRSTRWMKKPEF